MERESNMPDGMDRYDPAGKTMEELEDDLTLKEDEVYDEGNIVLTRDEVINRITYHAPTRTGIERHAALSGIFADMMEAVDRIVPVGREKSLVFTKLEEAKMWASAGVARDERTR